MRDYRAQDMAFEIVDMNLDERTKYRRLLAGKLTRLIPAIERRRRHCSRGSRLRHRPLSLAHAGRCGSVGNRRVPNPTDQ